MRSSLQRLSRLTLKLYAASVLQLLVAVAVAVLVGWLAFRGHRPEDFERGVRIGIRRLTPHLAEPQRLEQALRHLLDTSGASITLYRPDNTLLASSARPALAPLTPSQRKDMLRSGRFFIRHPPQMAVRLGTAGAPLGYAMVLREPPPTVPPPLVWGLGGALIAAAIMSLLLTQTFVEPLGALTKAAQALGSGDLTTRVAINARRDEFGQVADAFNEMAQRLAQLIRSQQELLANVSHELRTPIARVRVALDLASEGDGALAQQMLEGIGGDLGELERLIEDVLQMARLDLAEGHAGHLLPLAHKAPVDLGVVLRGAADRFTATHGPQRLAVTMDALLPTLYGDRMLLRRAIDNVLDNAAVYSGPDTQVRLSAHINGEHVEVEVEDRGIGISNEDIAQVGTPFFRTDRSRARRTGGIGLGLSLARRIVAAHGGKFAVDSEAGRGTTVRLCLPIDSSLAGVAPTLNRVTGQKG